MSTRPQFSPAPVITNGNMSGNLTSLPTIIQKLSMISYGISWTGTSPVGTVSVQVSNDFALNADGTVKTVGTWNTITLFYNGAFVTTVPVTGNSGNGFIDIDQTAAYAMRLIYTFTSGTGTLSAIIAAKVS